MLKIISKWNTWKFPNQYQRKIALLTFKRSKEIAMLFSSACSISGLAEKLKNIEPAWQNVFLKKENVYCKIKIKEQLAAKSKANKTGIDIANYINMMT